MSNNKDRGKMFSDGIVPKVNEADFMPKVKWSKKKKFAVVGIISLIIVIIFIIILVAYSFFSSPEEPSPTDQNNPEDPSEKNNPDDPSEKNNPDDPSKQNNPDDPSKQNNPDNPSKQNNPDDPSEQNKETDSKDKEDSKDADNDLYIKPNCAGVCSKPYDILVYNDNVLKAKLKECGYNEGSELFTFALKAIKRNNVIRACHNANPLMFNCEILKQSQDYSQYLSQIGALIHSDLDFHGEWLGENLSYSSEYNLTGETPIDMWYEEMPNYNFNNPGFTSRAGHFTQLVWKDSKEFGIGLYCKRSKCYITANYYPGGNYGWDDDYAKNVQKLQ